MTYAVGVAVTTKNGTGYVLALAPPRSILTSVIAELHIPAVGSPPSMIAKTVSSRGASTTRGSWVNTLRTGTRLRQLPGAVHWLSRIACQRIALLTATQLRDNCGR